MEIQRKKMEEEVKEQKGILDENFKKYFLGTITQTREND